MSKELQGAHSAGAGWLSGPACGDAGREARPLGRRKRHQETLRHGRGAKLQGLQSCLARGDPRDPLTFQPGAPGPQLSSAGGWQESRGPGLPHGLGGTVAGEKRLQAASVAEEPVSPPRAAPRGQIQSRARSVRARHWARRCCRAGAAVSRGVPASARAGAEVSARRPGGAPIPTPPRTHPRGPLARGAGSWEPPSPAPALEQTQKASESRRPPGTSARLPEPQCKPVPPSSPPRGLTGGSAADGDAQLQAAPGALGAGHGWAEGTQQLPRAPAPAPPPWTGAPGLPDGPGRARAGPGAPPPGRMRGVNPDPPPAQPRFSVRLAPGGTQMPPTPLLNLWLHPKSSCSPPGGTQTSPPPVP